MPWLVSLIILIYAALVAGVIWWVFARRKKEREGKFPLPEDVRLMRRPGEHLERRLRSLDESLVNQVPLLFVVPMLLFYAPQGFVWIFKTSYAPATLLASVAFAAAGVAFFIPRIVRNIENFRDHKLGLFGERVVADHLMSLLEHGYAVFHDVPCLGGAGPFNLDHVVVGEGRVVVVETKTRRKPIESEGANYEVQYDGRKLQWPNHSSVDELKQAKANAEWLQKELKSKLNLDITVHAALTFPGWYVRGGPPQATVLVEATKRLPDFIRGRFSAQLTAQQEDLVRRHLRSLCQDVGYRDLAV